MNVDQIRNLDDLLGTKVTSHKISRLTAPGENYGSLMLSVDVTTPNEEIKAVAKMVPPSEFIQQIFNTQVTFRNEIEFYKNIVPLLQNFQREHGVKDVIDISAKYYGSRLNLNNDNDAKVDEDAALVLENLKFKGYTTLDRLAGLDLEPAKLVLANLAKFHAVPLALRLQKPEVFEKEIKPFLSGFLPNMEMHEKMKDDHAKFIDQVPELAQFKERVMINMNQNPLIEAREPFATVVHNDCWTNNNMFKLVDGKLAKSILVDYQVLDYGSPARDVVFFIYSSLKNKVVEEHYEELLKWYHDIFFTTLQELHCDVSKYNYDAFLKEVEFEAKRSQYIHLSFMVFPIYAEKGSVGEISDFQKEEDLFSELQEKQRDKLVFIVNEFAKKNWI